MLKGDKAKVTIGHCTNIQDRAVIDTESSLESGFPADCEIGNWVTVGHGAIITSSVVRGNVMIGQGAIIPAGCVIETESIIAAGSVLLPGSLVAKRQLWAGNPAKFVREVTEDEADANVKVSGRR